MYTDHTLIIKELERSIKFYNWTSILSFLPKGSYLVGGYVRDIIMKRVTKEVDVDIVVPCNAIEIGKKIKKGDTVMIVEAMKTMNHVPSPTDGIVKEITVEDGQPVEFGQTIAILS